MRVSIMGFNQEYAISLRKEVDVRGKMVERKIDCTDLLILRWFVDFYPNMRKIEHEGKQYAWLTRKKLAADLPIVDISEKAFSERLQKLVDFKILTYVLIKEGGTFAAYGFGENYGKLLNTTVSVQTDTGGNSNGQGEGGQTDNKDKPIINKSVKDISKKKASKTSFDAIIAGYTDDEKTVELLKEWLKVRKAKRAAMTDLAIQMNIDKLDKLADQSHMSVVEYLSEVIYRGWAAFFVINNYSKPTKTVGANGIAIEDKPSELDGIL